MKLFIFGEPRKLIIRDLVKEKYLEYLQVPNSDPPCYEFLWGSIACAEANKIKLLEFLAKVHGTSPRYFPSQYQEALKDETKRAQAKAAARLLSPPEPPVALPTPNEVRGRVFTSSLKRLVNI